MKIRKTIAWILLSPPILIVLGFAYCEANKAYWDHQVRKLCEKDGGVTVFEHVELTPEEYRENDGEHGVINVPPEKSQDAEKYSYLTRDSETVLRNRNPSIQRFEFLIYRKSDGKELGKYVSYARSGGDFPTGFAEGSSFSCADFLPPNPSSIRQIFSVKGQ